MFLACLVLVINGFGKAPVTTHGSAVAVVGQRTGVVRVSWPSNRLSAIARDPISAMEFSDVCYVETRDRGEVYRRFAVHLPDETYRPLATKVAGFLGLLWEISNERFGTLCSRLRAKTIDVWITRTGDAGGELRQENIYVYNITADRSGLEWVRELAHEYGHYLLPGAAGYTEPEEWANGVLGERLFLRWISEELRSKRLDPEDLPFCKPEEIEQYCAKQPVPLIQRVRANGIDSSLMARRDHLAMDAFTALLLYTDRTYGSASIMEIVEFLPKDKTRVPGGMDFLKAFQTWVAAKRTFETSIPTNRSIMLYFPAGGYVATRRAMSPGASVTANSSSKNETIKLTINASGWNPIKILDGAAEVRLRWAHAAAKPASEQTRK